MYKVCRVSDDYPYRIISESNQIEDWTDAQDMAVQLLEDGVQCIRILLLNEDSDEWGLIQELNLERGIMPDPNFSTWSLTPYYVRLRNYEG
jgi:hypothetical protein|tara:strand:+ start:349 stop:621 length:273 start_codon:yes stop_codon:yes gene_type:complete